MFPGQETRTNIFLNMSTLKCLDYFLNAYIPFILAGGMRRSSSSGGRTNNLNRFLLFFHGTLHFQHSAGRSKQKKELKFFFFTQPAANEDQLSHRHQINGLLEEGVRKSFTTASLVLLLEVTKRTSFPSFLLSCSLK